MRLVKMLFRPRNRQVSPWSCSFHLYWPFAYDVVQIVGTRHTAHGTRHRAYGTRYMAHGIMHTLIHTIYKHSRWFAVPNKRMYIVHICISTTSIRSSDMANVCTVCTHYITDERTKNIVDGRFLFCQSTN